MNPYKRLRKYVLAWHSRYGRLPVEIRLSPQFAGQIFGMEASAWREAGFSASTAGRLADHFLDHGKYGLNVLNSLFGGARVWQPLGRPKAISVE
jgi:hypothetical protein